MKYFDNVKDVYEAIFSDPRFEIITNEFYVWQEKDKYIIEKKEKAKHEWKEYLHKDVVRSLRILNRENLIYSPFYKMFVGYDFIKIEVNKDVDIHSYFDDDYKKVISNVKRIQLLLFCKSKFEEIKQQDFTDKLELTFDMVTRIWIYPLQKLNGIYLPLDKRMTKLLAEIDAHARVNFIDIILGHDEEQFFLNPTIKEKIEWKDFLFDYHSGICIVLNERLPEYFSRKYPYIRKDPDICWNNKNLEFKIINKRDQDYLQLGYGFDGFEDWKLAIDIFLKEKNECKKFNEERSRDLEIESNKELTFRHSTNRWESIDQNPYYNSDIDMDQQGPEFWDSL